jgi:lysophospholipase L1-like esterase
MEVAIRVFVGSPWPERMPLVRVKADPGTGWRMLPGDFHYTYDIPVQLNGLGFRGPEPGPKAPGERRILAFGDSMLYGQGLADADLLTAAMEKELNKTPSACRSRVYNFGVRAYNINQEVALYRKLGALEGNHVMVFFYVNDFDEVNVSKRSQQFEKFDWVMFDLYAKPEGEPLRRWQTIQLLRSSALLMLVYDLYRGLTAGDSLERRILNGDRSPEVNRAIDRTKAYLKEFADLARQRGAKFTLVVEPFAGQVEKDMPGNRFQPELESFAKENGIDYLDLLPALVEAYRATEVPTIPFDGHYSAEAQKLMGVVSARHIGPC